jgi:Dolichyl-phosphate-mannose-protein mannosyltransferase
VSDTRERQPVGQAERAGAAPGAVLPRVWRVIRDNRLFGAALGAGAVLRLIAMLGYPGVLWFPGDSYLYLGAALRPVPVLSKAIGYSFFLRGIEPLHSLVLVALLQHLMGLAIAVMMYALARRARLPRWGATLCCLPVLLDGYEIQLEHLVMSETLFTFLIMIAVTLVMWRDTQAARPTPWVMLVAGLLTGYAILVREAGLPLIVILVGYFLVRWRGWLAPVAIAVGCMAPIAGYAAWFHSVHGQYLLNRATGFYLWGRTTSFSDCAVIKPPPAERPMCVSLPAAHRSPPGRFVWSARAQGVHNLPGGPVSAANNNLLTDFAIRAITAQPFGYLHSVAKGLGVAVYWKRLNWPSAYTAGSYHFPSRHQVVPAHKAWIPGGTAAQDARTYGRASPSRVVRPFSSVIRVYQRYFWTYGPLFGAILLIGLGGLIRFWRRLGGPGLLPWVVAVSLLLFPIATIDFDYRYLMPVLPFACLAAALAFAPREVPGETTRPAT